MTDAHVAADLGVFLAGAMSRQEAREVRAHLDGCPYCAGELGELREVTDVLDGLTPELLLDGPPDGGDLLLRRAVRQVRRESAPGRRRVGWAAAAAVLGAACLGGGFVVGQGAVEPVVVAAPPSAPSADGARTARAVDARTGAEMAVTVVPASGWVRVAARIKGVPAGERCMLVVVGASGERELAGTWLASPNGQTGGTLLDGSALVAPDDVRSVEVQTEDGRRYVSVPV